MPIHLNLKGLPAGVALSDSPKGCTTVTFWTTEFVSSEDGNLLIERLDEVTRFFAPVFGPKGIKQSQVDHLLGIVWPDKRAVVYCNELALTSKVRPKTAIERGQRVYDDDIADVDSLDVGVDIPSNCGVVLVLSVGWRKGLFYDFSVFGRDGTERTEDLPRLFGRFWSRLMFQEMYAITEQQWQRLLEWGWFPFTWLKGKDRRRLIRSASKPQPPVDLLEELCRTFKGLLRSKVEAWQSHPQLREESAFFLSAQECFERQDFMSCINNLYPRIEGILRKLYLDAGGKVSQKNMVRNLVECKDEASLLLPRKFQEYLLKFYFGSFDEKGQVLPLSRNTIGHGISRASDYDFVKSSLGFMIVDQIFYYLEPIPK